MAQSDTPLTPATLIAELLEDVSRTTVVLAVILAGIVLYALYRTLSGSANEIRKGKIARFLQFLQDLKWRIDRLRIHTPGSAVLDEAENTLAALRKNAEKPRGDADWNAAYTMERQLIELFTEADAKEVDYDYARNLEQARGLGLAEFPLYEEKADEGDAGEKKLALAKLVGDMQWARAEAYAKRKVAVAFVSRTGFLMLVSGVVMTMFLSIDPPFYDAGGFSGLDFAVISGVFGASFFMLARSQEALRISSYEEIRRSLDWPLLLIRLAFGGAAAAALYFFFETDLLSGQLTPKLNQIDYDGLRIVVMNEAGEVIDRAAAGVADDGTVPLLAADGTVLGRVEAMAPTPSVPNRNLALLFFWSFLAGFSERLVPSLLKGKSEEVSPDKPG